MNESGSSYKVIFFSLVLSVKVKSLILGLWVFLVMVVIFAAIFVVVYLKTRTIGQELTEENPMEMSEVLERKLESSEGNSKVIYCLKSALSAMWLPAVVGSHPLTFISASLSTLIAKILVLLLAVILAFSFQVEIHPRPFILWSRVGKVLTCSFFQTSLEHSIAGQATLR